MNTQLSQEMKIDLIFNFLFNSNSHIKEEDFWNTLTAKEIKDLKKISKEKTISFDQFKKQL